MKTVTVKSNQTIYDIAVAHYGTCEAGVELIDTNPELMNDDRAKIAAGIDPIANKDFYFDLALKEGSVVLIDTGSRTMKKNIVREIDKEVTTFELKGYGTND